MHDCVEKFVDIALNKRQGVRMKNGSVSGDMRDLFIEAVGQGWMVERTAKNHFKLIPPDVTKPIVLCAGTPRDREQALRNTLARMRASGFTE